MGKILKIFLNPFIPSVYHLSFLTCATVNCQNVFYALVQIIIRNIQQDGGKQTNKQKQKHKVQLCTMILDSSSRLTIH